MVGELFQYIIPYFVKNDDLLKSRTVLKINGFEVIKSIDESVILEEDQTQQPKRWNSIKHDFRFVCEQIHVVLLYLVHEETLE